MVRLSSLRSGFTPPREAAAGIVVTALIAAGVLLGGAAAQAIVPAPGSIEMVSVAANGASAGANSLQSVVSRDGRFVAFVSKAKLTDIVTGGFQQVYVRDLVSGITTMVSVDASGTAGGGGLSEHPSISDDGRFVAFDSDAPGLHPVVAALSPASQVYVRDVPGSSTDLISMRFDEKDGGKLQSVRPSISGDGSVVAFQSQSGDLISSTANIGFEVFVASRSAHPKPSVASLSDGSSTELADNVAIAPHISADGSTVAFSSTAKNLGADNGKMQVFTRTLATNKTTLVSFATGTGPRRAADNGSADVSLSADGSRVAYGSFASNITGELQIGLTAAVFVYDSATATNVLVSYDKTNSTRADGSSGTPSISADGRVVAFSSTASDLAYTTVEPSVTSQNQVYVRDLARKATLMVSLARQSRLGGADDSDEPSISADGRFVSFTSLAPGLTTVDPGMNLAQVYEVGVPPFVDPTDPTPTATPAATTLPAIAAATAITSPDARGGSSGQLASTGNDTFAPFALLAALALAVGLGLTHRAASGSRRRKGMR
ncbi:hypothetical protein B7R54_01455 [Subtercola boreus]|uniref:Uncharacterized protein n=1 Tax=Subtercola boreus TaxID=120213 RepID=A0A3E0VF81_9MICO|nr:PD40 domain-containing protein [Subtercola boreus]RFA08030.1 hypothetical protein B7R54_01455 [Subtercola boreus]TQL55098.1 WD40 repeat protein [Subtercola boreus]